MIKFFDRLFPARSRFAVLFTVATNFIVYYGALIINGGRVHYQTDLPVDALIPFLPFTVFIYIGAFLQWAVSYIHLSQTEREYCYTFCAALSVAKLLCLVIFLVYPTQVSSVPEVTGGGFAAFCTRFLYKIDAPSTNLFPSIHCLESWVALRIAFSSKRSNTIYKVISAVFTALVFVSVVTIKQHYIIDIPAGILIAEIGILLSKKLNISRFFFAADKKIRGEEK